MISAPLPGNESERLALLKRYEIMDSLPEQAYDDLLAIAAGICGTSMGAVSLIDPDRQWFKSQRGLPIQQTSRDVAFCAHAILHAHEIMVVPDALKDERFLDNPLVTGAPGIRFYAGAPLVARNGVALGTLCVIDDMPHDITSFQREALTGLSRQVVALLELRAAHKELRNHLGEREWYERILEIREKELIAENMHLSHVSRIDALTGLLNRGALNAEMETALAGAASSGGSMAMAIMDIDHFKAMNDLYGHPAGDAVLKSIARTLEAHCPTGATLGRLGGEEFALLLPGQSAANAALACERMRVAVERMSEDMPVTISIGVAMCRSGDVVSSLYSRADVALYSAKRGGRNRIEIVE